MGTTRRRHLLLGAGCVLVVAGIAAMIVVAFPGSSEAAPTKEQFLARVAAICRVYGPKLDKVPGPNDIAVPGEIVTSVEKALPLLQAENRAVHALRSPAELKASLRRWHALDDRSLAELEDALRAAREPDISTMGVAYVRYLLDGLRAEKVGRTIGFPRPPC
jgi:hypothetical protein